jgi:hypothetical protein
MAYLTHAFILTFGATLVIAAGFSVLEPIVEDFSNDIRINLENSIPTF